MPMNVRMPEPGETLVGKYLLHRVIGRGGVGVVYEGEHLRLRQRVAIKVLAPEMVAHREMVERFEREARAMAALQSAQVTRVTDVDITPEGVPFLVMEFLQGADLQHELKTRGALPIAEAVYWVRQACIGMAIVHSAGIVHRDLKPANLFLVDGGHGQPRTLKIMDFGISKIAGEDYEMTMTQTSLGTPAYMSPEQVRSAKSIDGRTDVWSLGVILYRALTGKLPFQGSGSTGMAVAIVNDTPIPIETLRPDLPPALVEVIRRTLEKSVEARLANVRVLSDALLPFENMTSVAPAIAADPRADAGPSIAGQSMHTVITPRRSYALPILLGAALGLAGVGAVILTRGEPSVHQPAAPPAKKVVVPAPSPVVVEAPSPPPSASPSVSVAPSVAPPTAPPKPPGKSFEPPPSKPFDPPAPKKDPPKTPPSSMPVLL